MTARDEVLARVRAALTDRPGAPAAAPGAPPRPDVRAAAPGTPPRPDRDLARLFAERAGEYRATVRHATPATVAEAVAAALAARGGHRVVAAPGLPTAWRPAGVEVVGDDGLTPVRLDALDGVLTGCALAIAETGTIALDGGPRCGRRALTLVPDLHVCVIEEEQIVASLADAFRRLRPESPITFVSGPSATSDIELHRVEGVHGPRTLEIVLIAAGSSGGQVSQAVSSASAPGRT